MTPPAPQRAEARFDGIKDGRIRDENLNRLGKRLVYHFHVLLKTAHIHLAGNVALAQPTERLIKTVTEIVGWGGDARLRRDHDYLYLDDLRLRMDLEGYLGFSEVMEALRRRDVGAVRFLNAMTPGEVMIFAYLWAGTPPAPLDIFQQQLRDQAIERIEVEPFVPPKAPQRQERQTQKALAKRTYVRTLTAVGEVMESVKLKQAVGVKKSKRVVQGLVDIMLQDETTLMGLSTLRSHDEYTYSHCVNVCILALALGQRLGFDKAQLSKLGIAALFHDVGKALIPLEILNKATNFTDDEWRVIRRHPIFGVKSLLRLKGLDDISTKVVIAGFEHHLNYDLSGYPKLAAPRKLTLFGRIISLADCYDAMTASRIYNRIPLSPDRALRLMYQGSGTTYDPLLMKLFVNCMGVYPIGTVVSLESGETGVVTGTHQSADRLKLPTIKLIRDAQGRDIDGETVDLSDPACPPARRIVATADAASLQIDLASLFA